MSTETPQPEAAKPEVKPEVKTLIGLDNQMTNWLAYITRESNGVFAIIDDTKKDATMFRCVAKCRESVCWWYINKEIFNVLAFMCRDVDLNKVREMFALLECQLKLEKQSIFYPSQHKDCFVMYQSPWWMETPVRRQVLTLLLRTAACYYEGDMQAAFEKYHLARRCKAALNHFLAGNTEFTAASMGGGFCDFFYGSSASAITTYLKPVEAPKVKEPIKS